MSFDFPASLRRVKPDKRSTALNYRPASELTCVSDLSSSASPNILLDTNVYIHAAAGRLPVEVAELIGRVLVFNSSVCVAELAAGVGHANPALPTWRPMREHYKAVIERMQPSRAITPDSVVWSEAGLIAGVLARIQNYQRQQRLDCLNDALILLSAAKAGLSVLTENRKDFDLIQQLAPAVRFIHYQAVK